jgi:hypothetical protein
LRDLKAFDLWDFGPYLKFFMDETDAAAAATGMTEGSGRLGLEPPNAAMLHLVVTTLSKVWLQRAALLDLRRGGFGQIGR